MNVRLDAELVRRGLSRSRGQARDLVASGAVLVRGAAAAKASMPVDSNTAIDISPAAETGWVSRAAVKLTAALDIFAADGLSAAGKRAVDVGASTGGFTQVLLARGVTSVAAVDVGHGQLVPALHADPRVSDLSGHNVRDLDPDAIGGPFQLLVADLSFISLRLVLPDLRRLTCADGDLVLLVKPQFEVGRSHLGKGVVRSDRVRLRAVQDVLAAAVELSLQPMGLTRSPIAGTSGNLEYLVWVTARTGGQDPRDWIERFGDILTSGPEDDR